MRKNTHLSDEPKFICNFLSRRLISDLRSRAKGSANRTENKINYLFFYPEACGQAFKNS